MPDDPTYELFRLWNETKKTEWPKLWSRELQARYACWLIGVGAYCDELTDLGHHWLREVAQRGLGVEQPKACVCA